MARREQLTLELEAADPIVVGLSAPVTVRVINRGSAPTSVSSRLNLMEGDVRLSVEDPDGTTRVLKGWQADTAARRVELPPHHQIECGINLLWTDGGAAFPKTGQYVIGAEYDPSPNSETIVSQPVTVTARSPRSEEEREAASILAEEPVRKALVWARSDAAPDQLQKLARRFPNTLDGKLAGLLLYGGDTGARADATFRGADPVPLARWIAMLSTPYSDAGRKLAANFASHLQSHDGKAADSETTDRSIRIVKVLPVTLK